MAVLPVIADTFRCALNWTHANLGTATNVMHIVAPGETPGSVFTELDAKVTAGMWSWVDSGAHISTVDITPLDGTGATGTFSTTGPAKWSGGSGENSGVPQAAGIIKLLTNLRGRSFRGRLFLPWVAENETIHGSLGDVAAVEAAWLTFSNALVADGFAMCVASYKLASQHQVTAIVAELKLATQKRRMDRIRNA